MMIVTYVCRYVHTWYNTVILLVEVKHIHDKEPPQTSTSHKADLPGTISSGSIPKALVFQNPGLSL